MEGKGDAMKDGLHGRAWVVLTLLLTAAFLWDLAAPMGAGAYRLPDTGQNKCYDDNGEIPCPQWGEPYYGQDAQYRGAQPSFRDNGDGTVSDLNTGLMWQKEDKQNADYNTRTWQQAVNYCSALSLADHTDWRLPTVKELSTLVNFGRYDPSIDTKFFPDCLWNFYWSSSTLADYPDDAWGVLFFDGYVDYGGKSYGSYVRCVRGGP
jgi:hypothetical protein